MLDALYNNESKLDQIMTEGFKRIDEAVEMVIGKYPKNDMQELKDYMDAIHEKATLSFEDRMSEDWYGKGKVAGKAFMDAQRELNYRMAEMAEQAALQSSPIWIAQEEAARRQGQGLMNIGDQNAQGSPLNQLGAAYRNAFGRC